MDKRALYLSKLGIGSTKRQTGILKEHLVRPRPEIEPGGISKTKSLSNIGPKTFHFLKHHNGTEPSSPEESKEDNVVEEVDANTKFPTPDHPLPKNAIIEKVYETFTDEDSGGFSLNFIQKSNDDIRRNYFQKLISKKIWIPPKEKPRSHQSVIVFDWDDTLLCTSYLNPTGYIEDCEIPPHMQHHLTSLQEAVCKILNMAIEMGKTFIITNAAPGWVEFSSQKYMPKVVEIIEQITIISARGKYENQFPGNCQQWKLHAFLLTQKDLDQEIITNIVALGDSNIEMDAAHHLATKFSTALIKTVKFRENPTPDELVKQLNLVIQKFSQICSNVRNLTIRLERKYPSGGHKKE